MVQAVLGEQALKARRAIKSRGTGEEHWRTDYIGKPGDGTLKNEPQAFLIDMSANEVIVPHFHEVDQFQVFVAGSGSLGRNKDGAEPLSIHYADHHTGYGPINAGPQGYAYFTLRAKSDPGAHYLHKPGYREALKPSAKRHGVADGIALSTEPVLMDMKETKVEQLMPELGSGDGLGVSMIRMGPGLSFTGPDPRPTGGQYYLVVNGSLEFGGAQYTKWSTVFLTGEESPLSFKSGTKGLEALLLQFAKHES